MAKAYEIGSGRMTLEALEALMDTGASIELSKELREKVVACRKYLDEKLEDSEALFYGINTGFGSLCNIQISKEATESLQYNLVRSHACGMGDEVDLSIVRMIILTKIRSLAFGYSAVQEVVLDRLIDQYNKGVFPQIFELGSLGASGDLAPLAHMALPLFGEGYLYCDGELKPSAEVLSDLGWDKLALASKEGLALLNGTQFSLSHGLWSILELQHLWDLANLCATLSIDAFDCSSSPYDEKLHRIRPHLGQLTTAKVIFNLLSQSEIAQSEKVNVQDPYAFRCVPQVHGATFDTIQYVRSILETELNSVTDNPNIFVEEDAILSGGNFHAQPLALALDYLAIAASELASISERRTYQLISGLRGLPAFLVADPGLHSGFMIPQYTAASMVSQNKQLCTPASVDSIVSSNGQEDHVSMAANAGTKLKRVIKNVERVLAIEFMTATQALQFRQGMKTHPELEALISEYRGEVPFVDQDRILSDDIKKTMKFARSKRSAIRQLMEQAKA